MNAKARTFIAVSALLAANLGMPARVGAEIRDIPHPFILLTREEATAIRKRIDTEPLARKQYERMKAIETASSRYRRTLFNLFNYLVMGDKVAGQAEKGDLLGFIGARPPLSTPGNPETGNAPWRDDRTLDALRYDILYDELTPEQRKGVEDTIRGYVEWFEKNPGPLVHAPRTGWLPNMQWPTAAGIHVLAAASKNEDLIRRTFETTGGWKWYFDRYIADGQFYMEEFGKYYSNIGSMILWCQALDKLGLDSLGWGYAGKPQPEVGKVGGATMGRFLAMLITAGYPRINRADGTPDYISVTMGDAGDARILSGYFPTPTKIKDGKPVEPVSPWSGGNPYWGGGTMNGMIAATRQPIPKMMQPLWWEAGHRKFPDAGFDYFLAQMREPGEDLYFPSFYFGLGPIDPAKVKPPSVKSFVAPERGFALLKAEESPAYWESPKPAVSLQFGMYYVHYVHDCFSILQYVADNRVIYTRQGRMIGGYAGGDPCRDSVRGQGSGVVVDSAQAQDIDSGEEGIRNERLRHLFTPLAKFVAISTKPMSARNQTTNTDWFASHMGIYHNVAQERCLALTDDYLFDVSCLRSTGDRVYDWHVQSQGQFVGADQAPWSDSADLANGRFWFAGSGTPPLNVRAKDVGDAAWFQSVVQAGGGDQAVGVRVAMLGGAGTVLYALTLPGCDTNRHSTLLVRRKSPSTTFAALHEPFKGGLQGYKVERLDRIVENDAGIVVAIVGKMGSGINDRIAVRTGATPDRSDTLTGADESFTFTDFAWARIGAESVDAWGRIDGLRLKVNGRPILKLNGQKTEAIVKDGILTYP